MQYQIVKFRYIYYKKKTFFFLSPQDLSQLRVEIHPIDADNEVETQTSVVTPITTEPVPPLVDMSSNVILSGPDCIQGVCTFRFFSYLEKNF